MKRIFQQSCLFLMLALSPAVILPAAAHAQELSSTKGGLIGQITDPTGAAIPGAKVTVTGNEGAKVVTSDEDGKFSVSSLTPGLYTINVAKDGFRATEAKNLVVVINRNSSVDLKLEPGAVAETVQVDAQTASIDTGSTAVGANLTDQFYNSVPVARNVGSLFAVSPGVVNSGGAGTSNPSIGGASGLENQYYADGVSIGDAGYGGLGVYSPTYGSLGTGINLTFIQEVQVKTAAFEPKYGSADGGVVQIVTKSGGTTYHGAFSAYFAPEALSGAQRYADNYFDRVNVHGRVFSQPQYDGAVEIGGYVPGQYTHDKLFFYGAYNPALNQWNWIAPAVAGGPLAAAPTTNSTTINSWAAKVSFVPSSVFTVDASAFGDPSRTNAGYGYVNQDTFPYYPNLNLPNDTGFSRWNYGSRSESLHITGTPNATSVFNLTASAKKSGFTEVGLQNVYQIDDYSGAVQAGEFTAQGLGYTQNPQTHAYTFGADAQKTITLFHQQHTFSIGYNYLHNIYNLTKAYSGASFAFPTTNAAGVATPTGLSGATSDAGFNLEAADGTCPTSLCPLFNGTQVYLQQTRGIFSNPVTPSSMNYNVLYGNDNWAITPRITVDAGIRWDQEQLNGIVQSYVFNDNWSPRLGINFDPKGDGKSKVFFNWGRYTQELTEDAAIRALGQELDIYQANWTPQNDGNGNVVVNANGTVNPILDAAHLISGDPAAGTAGSNLSYSGGGYAELIAPKTKLNYEEEYVAGIEKQYAGFVFSARYSDRRLLRIIEDQSGASPEGNQSGFVAQNFLIGNPSATSDYFTNEVETPYTYNAAAPNLGAPASCVVNYNTGIANGPFINSAAQVAGPGGACGDGNPLAGAPIPDGKPDGAPNARRHYQSVELEANKNFSHNFLLRVNYRYAKLFGNYEGAYRNDNGQSDPSISSLFDFTLGALGMLGDQYVPGYLNTDRRQVGNIYGSYVVPSGFAKKLTAGIGLNGASGTPITNLGAHPVYHNDGEIPLGGRGAEGRTASNFIVNIHTDYPIKVGEKFNLKLAFDTFNLTNSRSLTAVDQDSAISYGNTNADFLKPLSFQRAIYGRGSIRFEF